MHRLPDSPPPDDVSDEDAGAADRSGRSPRRAIARLFLATGAAAALGAALIPTLILSDGAPAQSRTYGALLAALLVAGTVAWLWFALRRLFLRPIGRLATDIRTLSATESAPLWLDTGDYPALAPLPGAVNALAGRLTKARHEIDHAVARAAEQYTESNNRLAAILADLDEGVLVCNLRHQLLLHNRAALDLLQAEPHPTGTAAPPRALISLMLADPVRHTLERLIRQAGFEDGARDGDAGRFIGGTPNGRILLDGRMSLVFHEGHLKGSGPVINNRTVTGYVLTFTDATRELAALGCRDSLLRATTEDLRSPLANLRAVMETLDSCPDLEADQLRRFEEAMRSECDSLTRHLERIAEQYRTTLTGNWPMSDLRSLTLIELVRHRVSVHRGVTIIPTGIPCRLHGDSFSLVVLLDHLIERIGEKTGAAIFDLSGEPAARWIYLDLFWSGAAIPSATIDEWKADPLPAALGGLTVGDVLRHHRSDLWSEIREGGRARLRLPLPPALASGEQTPRPPVYLDDVDFTALRQPPDGAADLSQRLDDMSFVVFGIETTGPDADGGDEIVAFSAVRVFGRRILTNDTFLALVNPGRPIPHEATARHGISDQQVQDQPGIDAVLPRFRAFVGDDALVAHRAGPAISFLRAKERTAGLRFANPVIDTMLLSLKLQGPSSDLSLDSIASLLGISAIDRHTALGDRLIAAAILIAQIDVLRGHGIVTLGEVLHESNALIDLHARERLL